MNILKDTYLELGDTEERAKELQDKEVPRLAEKPLEVLRAAWEILEDGFKNPRATMEQKSENVIKISLLQTAIVYKAFKED